MHINSCAVHKYILCIAGGEFGVARGASILRFFWEVLNYIPEELRKEEIFMKSIVPIISSGYDPNMDDS